MHLVTWPHTCEYYHLHLNTVMNSFLKNCYVMLLRNSVSKPKIISNLLSLSLSLWSCLYAGPSFPSAECSTFPLHSGLFSSTKVEKSREWRHPAKTQKLLQSTRMLENSPNPWSVCLWLHSRQYGCGGGFHLVVGGLSLQTFCGGQLLKWCWINIVDSCNNCFWQYGTLIFSEHQNKYPNS